MKNLKSVLVALCLLVSTVILAQDKIQKRPGGEILNVKVVEVTEDYVGYRLPNDLNGPIYKIRKESISKITYENGMVESFGANSAPGEMVAPAPPTASAPAPMRMSEGFKMNIINFDFFSILFNEVGLSYERILDNGFIGFKVPIIIGMGTNKETQIRPLGNNFQTGLDINLYPTGQGKVRYFIGPSVRFGQAYDYYSTSVYNSSNGGYYDSYEMRSDFNLFAFQVNNGVVFQPTSHFNISLVTGIGLRRLTDRSGIKSTIAENYGTFNANVAYRF